ncbi:hypothetical protein [Methyloceanibacter sp.]|uniref:hypothetical protein n=1 Tax=Methyloceanibacter sp. TaxID=1965321 RepID=UPI0035616EA0
MMNVKQIRHDIAAAVLAAIVAVLASTASFAGDQTGTYMTEDTKGNAFRIVLAGDGMATGSKDGHDLNGTWTKDGDAAVIKWSTGWITTLARDGDAYKKAVHRPGTPLDGPPTHTTGAKKLE